MTYIKRQKKKKARQNLEIAFRFMKSLGGIFEAAGGSPRVAGGSLGDCPEG